MKETAIPTIEFDNGHEYNYKKVPLVKVESSNIEHIGYNEEDKLLYVLFKTRNTAERPMYIYEAVEKSVFEDMLKAESKGKFFMSNIRDKYNFVKDTYFSTE